MNDRPEGSQFAYDRVAYPGHVGEYYSPNRLRASALLHGFRSADPATASVLEIGCGEGLNLSGYGAVSPNTRLAGFDLSSEAIDRGRALVEAAGLKNVDLHVGNALTYPRDGEKFDYIVCHGVLSWVPAPVRDAIVELMGARLAPGGVGYFGYDCLPGASAKAAIVPFLREWVGDIADPVEAMKKAAGGIALLKRSQLEGSRLHSQLDILIENFHTYNPAYFFHDWLAEYYAPIDLRQFIPLAQANNLQIAGATAGYDLLYENLDEEAIALLESYGADAGRRLAALDVLYGGHIFHRDMMIRIDAPPEAAPDGVTELSFAFTGTREELTAEEEGGPAIKYSAGDNANVTTDTATSIAVLDCLHHAGGAELSYDELLSRTGVLDEHLNAILRTVCALGLVTPHSTPQPFVLKPGERPRAGILARTMLARGDQGVNLRTNGVHFPDRETQCLIVFSDGTRTRPEIAAAMAESLKKEIVLGDVEKTIDHLAGLRVFEA